MLTCNEYIAKSILKYLLMHTTSSNAKKCFDSTFNTLAKWFDFEWHTYRKSNVEFERWMSNVRLNSRPPIKIRNSLCRFSSYSHQIWVRRICFGSQTYVQIKWNDMKSIMFQIYWIVWQRDSRSRNAVRAMLWQACAHTHARGYLMGYVMNDYYFGAFHGILKHFICHRYS